MSYAFDILVASPSSQPYLKNVRTRAADRRDNKKNLYHGPLAKLCIVEQQLLLFAGYSESAQEIVDLK